MFNRNDPNETNLGKPALKPALYDPPASVAKTAATPAVRTGLPPPPAPVKESPPAVPRSEVAAPTSSASSAGQVAADGGGSKLFIGVNIKLKGVEISDCDVLVIEGHVEATVNSKEMQIDQPGTLTGTALIDVAEIRGEFSGELTARTRLVVHGTGRVSGTIRYGKLIVAEGGELTGDVKRLDSEAQRSLLPPADGRRPHAAATESVPTLTSPVHPGGATRAYSS